MRYFKHIYALLFYKWKCKFLKNSFLFSFTEKIFLAGHLLNRITELVQ